jgi:hypothetical protein
VLEGALGDVRAAEDVADQPRGVGDGDAAVLQLEPRLAHFAAGVVEHGGQQEWVKRSIVHSLTTTGFRPAKTT